MSIDTTQYSEILGQGQEAVRKAVDTWTRTVTNVVGQLPALPTQADAETAIDRYFDLNEKLLGAQRDFAKRLVGFAAVAGTAVQEQVEPVVNAAKAATQA
jgi:hypothetical protein